jgi:nicotinate phosphoribosyltransferase
MLIGRVVNIKEWRLLIFFFARIVSEPNAFLNRKRTVYQIFFLAFDGEFALFAGLEECLKFVNNYKFHATDIDYLRTTLPKYVETEFYNYLAALNMNDVKIYAVPEGKNSF